MGFSSIEFLLCFLPLFLLLYGVTPCYMKNAVLFTGSLVFYAFGEPKYLWLLIVSVSVNYFLGLHLARGANLKGKDKKQRKRKLEYKRKFLLVVAVAGNIGVLAVFKSGIGAGGLPLGISYY
ncbi:MAG: MBOAT family protein, partial [Acetatifactor sp.]|nr:MBOAT family protein [Acetatifactor sp.]